jgi:hypothetical protein
MVTAEIAIYGVNCYMMQLKRKFGDRYDGYRVKKVDPFFLLIPHIMPDRVDSQVYFSDEIEITALEKFVREHGETDLPGLKMYHVMIAAMIRLISQKPYLNRFVMRGKIFARNYITISMSIKRGKGEDALTTVVKPRFEPEDTLADVVRKFNEAVEENRKTETENDTDNTATIVGRLPAWLVRWFVAFMFFLDKRGRLPRAINHASPFHTSMFLTNMGSLGIRPIYHHIYEFGTTSVFVGMGKKETIYETKSDGSIVKRRKMGIKVVADERICDGNYYATSMRSLARYLHNPERLLVPPETVVLDDGIDMKGRI